MQYNLYTDVVFLFFSFFSKNIGERARTSTERYPACAGGSINPLRFKFYHSGSTDFEEKIEGL